MIWNPFRGCKKYSTGCKYCYIHKGDKRSGIETSKIVRTNDFYKPIAKNKDGTYKLKSGLVFTCFSSDFLIEEADIWRDQCWQMIRERSDLDFLFLTKRIERFHLCMPSDWEEGYENVIIACTIENQETANQRLGIFNQLPIKHRIITAQPLLEQVDISPFLANIECVVVGGESDMFARPLDYQWVLDIRAQCIQSHVNFEFRQCGSHFIKDKKMYHLKVKDLRKQAKKANINYSINN